jgi:hypothetical protein
MAVPYDSDREIQSWLSECDPLVFAGIAQLVDSVLALRRSATRKKWLSAKNREAVSIASSEQRAELSAMVLKSLKYRASHDLAYTFRKLFQREGGVSYGEILRDVAIGVAPKKKRKEAKAKMPRVASIADREEFVCECLLGKICEGKTPEELKQMFVESGLDLEKAQEVAREVASVGVLAIGLPALVQYIGKRTLKAILQQYLTWLLAKSMGQRAAQLFVEKLLGNVAQKRVAAAVSGLGYAALAYDMLKLLGPAKRITIPAVSMIASSRAMARL